MAHKNKTKNGALPFRQPLLPLLQTLYSRNLRR